MDNILAFQPLVYLIQHKAKGLSGDSVVQVETPKYLPRLFVASKPNSLVMSSLILQFTFLEKYILVLSVFTLSKRMNLQKEINH